MTTTLSKFYVYTTYPRQEFEQDVTDYIEILNRLSQNSYNNIHDYYWWLLLEFNEEYDTICKNIRTSLENYVDGKNLIINIDGDNDRFKDS